MLCFVVRLELREVWDATKSHGISLYWRGPKLWFGTKICCQWKKCLALRTSHVPKKAVLLMTRQILSCDKYLEPDTLYLQQKKCTKTVQMFTFCLFCCASSSSREFFVFHLLNYTISSVDTFALDLLLGTLKCLQSHFFSFWAPPKSGLHSLAIGFDGRNCMTQHPAWCLVAVKGHLWT